jgi:hypothetical protein
MLLAMHVNSFIKKDYMHAGRRLLHVGESGFFEEGMGVALHSERVLNREIEIAKAMGAPESKEPRCAGKVLEMLHTTKSAAVNFQRKKVKGKVGRPKAKGKAKQNAKGKAKAKGKPQRPRVDASGSPPKTPTTTTVCKRPAALMSDEKRESKKCVGLILDIPVDMPIEALPQDARGRGRQSYTITDKKGTIVEVLLKGNAFKINWPPKFKSGQINFNAAGPNKLPEVWEVLKTSVGWQQ